ncbi:MAG: hypothetical protein IKU25_02490 [Clostridia bacterium]|nr:hypothetical protein [Clostridia bacterium]
MKNKTMKLPVLIIVIGIIVAIVVSIFTGVVRIPTITEHDFNYSATYKLNGETKTIEGIYRCKFTNTGDDYDPADRCYEGSYISDSSEDGSSEHVIATKDNLELCVVFIFTSDYLMGDGDFGERYSDVVSEPYVAVFDKDEGYEYSDPETLGKFDVELVSWELPQAIENSFVFSHISHFSHAVVFPTLIAAILTVVAIIIFVKRENKSKFKPVDIATIVLNFAVCATLLPFVTVAAVLSDIVGTGPEIYHQIFYFFPAILVFCTAASVALRRKGHSAKSLIAELIGPAVFVVYLIVCGACGLL